jgi:hypothetical protein
MNALLVENFMAETFGRVLELSLQETGSYEAAYQRLRDTAFLELLQRRAEQQAEMAEAGQEFDVSAGMILREEELVPPGGYGPRSIAPREMARLREAREVGWDPAAYGSPGESLRARGRAFREEAGSDPEFGFDPVLAESFAQVEAARQAEDQRRARGHRLSPQQLEEFAAQRLAEDDGRQPIIPPTRPESLPAEPTEVRTNVEPQVIRRGRSRTANPESTSLDPVELANLLDSVEADVRARRQQRRFPVHTPEATSSRVRSVRDARDASRLLHRELGTTRAVVDADNWDRSGELFVTVPLEEEGKTAEAGVFFLNRVAPNWYMETVAGHPEFRNAVAFLVVIRLVDTDTGTSHLIYVRGRDNPVVELRDGRRIERVPVFLDDTVALRALARAVEKIQTSPFDALIPSRSRNPAVAIGTRFNVRSNVRVTGVENRGRRYASYLVPGQSYEVVEVYPNGTALVKEITFPATPWRAEVPTSEIELYVGSERVQNPTPSALIPLAYVLTSAVGLGASLTELHEALRAASSR